MGGNPVCKHHKVWQNAAGICKSSVIQQFRGYCVDAEDLKGGGATCGNVWSVTYSMINVPSSPRFSRCPVITTNRNAVGPPLPVYCESAFNWKPLFQPWHQSGAPRQAQLSEECAFEDAWLSSRNFWWESILLFVYDFISSVCFFYYYY